MPRAGQEVLAAPSLLPEAQASLAPSLPKEQSHEWRRAAALRAFPAACNEPLFHHFLPWNAARADPEFGTMTLLCVCGLCQASKLSSYLVLPTAGQHTDSPAGATCLVTCSQG